MPTVSRSLDLPPPFRLVALREAGDAFAHAGAHAAEHGAGSLVFVGRHDLAEFAVVLEPEEPLKVARLVFYAAMVALGEALAAAAPPEKPISFAWPDAVLIDHGLAGGCRLAWPERCAEDAVPQWLVVAAMIRTAAIPRTVSAPYPTATALGEEGFADCSAEGLVARFARHLMAGLDRWQEAGFAPIARAYSARLQCGGKIAGDGDLPGCENGNLVAALAAPSWLDPATGAPRIDWPSRLTGLPARQSGAAG